MPGRAGNAVAVAMGIWMAFVGSQAHAQVNHTIFPEGWDRSVRDRMFMRLSHVSAFVKTRSEDAYDVTGPVISNATLLEAGARGEAGSTGCGGTDFSNNDFDDCNNGFGYQLVNTIVGALGDLGMAGFGTPAGVKARIGNVSTAALSLGYWLNEERDWSLEAYLMAVPLTVKAYGDGINGQGRPNGIANQHILTTKMLPPMAILSRHFGRKDAMIRPYIGAGAMYAVMYDTKAENALNAYVGGKTSASIKNAFGVGPFAGLTSSAGSNWHVNLAVGQIKLKTHTTLTTRQTLIQATDAVIRDYPDRIVRLIERGDSDMVWYNTKEGTGLTRGVLHHALNGRADFGTFVRKQKNTLTSTIVSISIGTSF
jgi:outer membrane protein